MRAAAALALLLTAVPSGYAQLMISSNSSFEVNHQTTSQNGKLLTKHLLDLKHLLD